MDTDNEGRALAYHVAADPRAEVTAFCEQIKEEPERGKRTEMRQALEKDREHEKARDQFMIFSEWKIFWDLAKQLKKMSASMAYIIAFAEEYNAHTDEQGIFQTLLSKARYIDSGKVISNIKGFLANRQT